MAELVDAHDSKSCGVTHESSILSPGTVNKQDILVIVGPTASGKSALGVEVARRIGGEIISADSRQVYRGLDIGTGKITKSEMKGVRHHLLDIISPKRAFNAHDFSMRARHTIDEIGRRGNTPVIVGGTGFYIDVLLGRISLPDIPPNPALRMRLHKKNVAQLFSLLQKKNPSRASSMNDGERKNPVRLIRALEVASSTSRNIVHNDSVNRYNIIWIGIVPEKEVLQKKIKKRLDARLRHGMIAEARRLHASGLSYKRMEELGLEYRALARYLRGITTRPQMREELFRDILKYAKRQKTYWKRNGNIRWFADAKSALKYATSSALK